MLLVWLYFYETSQLPADGDFKLVSQDNYRTAGNVFLHLNGRALTNTESQSLPCNFIALSAGDRQFLSIFSVY